MTKRLILTVLTLAVLSSTGCMFFRKSKKPKESSAIATETEKEFQQRWVARRASELTAQGVAAATAELQATQEFREKFAFANKHK